MLYLYLHGFASSPASRKAQSFLARFEVAEQKLLIPALDQGDFEHLTLSRQLRAVEDLLQGQPARIAGSSMGGYLAALYAVSHPEVDRLVLLAPAFQMARRWEQLTPPDVLRSWKESGWMEVFHYGARQNRRIHYGLLEDARQFAPEPDFLQPALVFHGTHDSTVPVEFSREFCRTHPNALLRELDSDHELSNSVEAISAEATSFLLAP